MKMIFKLLIFGLFSNIIRQAFPAEPLNATANPSNVRAKACDEQLSWYRDTTKKVEELFDQYYNEYKKFKQANNSKESTVEDEHNEFEKQVTEALDRYQENAKKIDYISDESARLAICSKEIDWFRVLDRNLTHSAINIKTDVLNALDALGVRKQVRDDFDRNLRRIVNFLIIINITKNLFKDVNSLTNKASMKTKDGVALEKKYGFREDGELVETAQAFDEYDDILAPNDEDKEIEENLKELEDDTEVRAAEDRAELREQEERITEEESKNENVEKLEGEIEEPLRL